MIGHYIYIYIYLLDKVPQDITSTVPNIYAHMHKLDKKDNENKKTTSTVE